MSDKKGTFSPPKHLKLVDKNTAPVPSLDTPDPEPVDTPDPADVQARAVASDFFEFACAGTLKLVFAVGVGPNGKFFRNIGGSGNAYELLGFIELQKQELVNVITASQKEDPSGGASSKVAPGTTSGNEVPQDPPAISK